MNIANIAFSKEMQPATLHWMISDKDESIVVESMKDGLHVYYNPVGVMTNNPPFNYMLFSLNDYALLFPKQPTNTFGTDLNLYSRLLFTAVLSPAQKLPVSNRLIIKAL